jgi:transcriptional regulator with XRE-family HTH domain
MKRRDDFDYAAFRAKLYDLRKCYLLTQDDVAEALMIDRSAYSNYETGRTMPSVTSLKVLAEMYHVSADYLLGLKEEEIEMGGLTRRLMMQPVKRRGRKSKASPKSKNPPER